MTPEQHLAVVHTLLCESGMDGVLSPGFQRPLGVLEVIPAAGHTTEGLRQTLVESGWTTDPMPWLRRRTKPWVQWSLRSPTRPMGLHLEGETTGHLALHVDTFNPTRWWHWPGHLYFDHWGWRTRRVARLRTQVQARACPRMRKKASRKDAKTQRGKDSR